MFEIIPTSTVSLNHSHYMAVNIRVATTWRLISEFQDPQKLSSFLLAAPQVQTLELLTM
jgi:hypothetical protein